MNAQHTQGRLTTGHDGHGGMYLEDEHGRQVGYVSNRKEQEANARRLALCWNALLDAPTERLEQAVHLGITDVSLGNLFTARLELQAQRDKLLAALEVCREMVGHPDNIGFIDAAIAEVKGSL